MSGHCRERLAERMQNGHPIAMGWRPILTLSCLVRERLAARVICLSCHRAVVLDPQKLRVRYWRLRGGDAIEDVARRMRCRVCHHRGAKIEPSTLPVTDREGEPPGEGRDNFGPNFWINERRLPYSTSFRI